MIAPLAKFIDWSAIQAVTLMMPPDCMQRHRLEEAVQFLNGPGFIPAESQPAQLDFIPDAPGARFRFPTPRPGEFAENNVVHGQLSLREQLDWGRETKRKRSRGGLAAAAVLNDLSQPLTARSISPVAPDTARLPP